MSARRLGGLALLAVAAVALGACGGGTSDGGAADYEATDMASGGDVSVTSLRGRPALLVSWATWCAECDEVLDAVQDLAESPVGEGVEVVAVNIDAGDRLPAITDKIAAHDLTTQLWRDERNDFKWAFGALGVPTTVILDADGEVAGVFAGAAAFEGSEIADALDALRTPDR